MRWQWAPRPSATRLAGLRTGAFWETRRPGVDIISGASLAPHTISRLLSIVRIASYSGLPSGLAAPFRLTA
jgi:hypothetical protein